MSTGYKTFYGEFSLRQWIDMILKKDIILPEYQRNFVWKVNDVKRLIDSLENDYIVPPVIIAQKGDKNYLLDGQQRLSSVLLSFFNIFPKNNNHIDVYNSDVHTEYEEENNEGIIKENEEIIYWKFSYIQDKFDEYKKDINKLREKLCCDTTNYILENYNVNEDFFQKKFIGYAFSMHISNTNSNIHAHFSKTFHAINSTGKKLEYRESRRSYYWLIPQLSKLFEPEFTTRIFVVPSVGNKYLIDFVRPLAFAVDQFISSKGDISTSDIARGYGKKIEEYFTGFVKHYSGLDEDNKFNFFGDRCSVIPDDAIDKRISHIENICKIDNFLPQFTATYEYDYYFFGLVFWIVVQGKRIEIDDVQNLNTIFKRAIDNYKKEENNITKYDTLNKIRSRMRESIKIYERHIKGDI